MVYSSGVFHLLHFEWLKVEHLESNTRYISSCVWLEWHDYYVVSCLGSDCFCRRLSTDVVVDGCQRYEKHFRSSQFYTVQCHKDFFRISTNNLVFILDCTFSLAADCVTTHVIIMLQLSQTLLLVGRPTIKLPSCFVSNLSHVQWTIPQTHKRGSTFFPRCRCRKCRKLGKLMSNMLTNSVIFSAFKHTDPLTVLSRPTLKDGEVNGVYSDTNLRTQNGKIIEWF